MRKSVIAIIIIVLVVLYMSVFVVKEGERGITPVSYTHLTLPTIA